MRSMQYKYSTTHFISKLCSDFFLISTFLPSYGQIKHLNLPFHRLINFNILLQRLWYSSSDGRNNEFNFFWNWIFWYWIMLLLLLFFFTEKKKTLNDTTIGNCFNISSTTTWSTLWKAVEVKVNNIWNSHPICISINLFDNYYYGLTYY